MFHVILSFWSFQQILQQISANRNQVAQQVSHKKNYIYICINIYIPSNPVGLDDRIPIMNNSKKLISMKLAKGSE